MQNKKIGILTFYYRNYNFGGVLQAFALVYALNKNFPVQAEQICYQFEKKITPVDRSNQKKETIHRAFEKGVFCGIRELFIKSIQKLVTKLYYKKVAPNINYRKAKFEQFEEIIPHSKIVYTDDTIKNSLKDYNVFICGGDQIWNDWGRIHTAHSAEVFTLSFVNDHISKFSYAPSVPSDSLKSSFLEKIKVGISKLDLVSVREKSSIPFVQNLTDKKVIKMIDPVLLLERDEWDKIAITNKHKDYMLCYLLGADKKQRKSVEHLAKRLNLTIITFPHILGNVRTCDFRFGDIKDYSSGPNEFVGLIRNAKLVVTDSFHASVFSTIFHKPFYVLERETVVGGSSMHSRMTDFLEDYNLQQQIVTVDQLNQVEKIPDIDFDIFEDKISDQRKESFDFLKKGIFN